ncbi:uncharacterized protein PHA67_002502 [Liasis olivaceus]
MRWIKPMQSQHLSPIVTELKPTRKDPGASGRRGSKFRGGTEGHALGCPPGCFSSDTSTPASSGEAGKGCSDACAVRALVRGLARSSLERGTAAALRPAAVAGFAPPYGEAAAVVSVAGSHATGADSARAGSEAALRAARYARPMVND